jgi:multiple sugar transport system ATP-binding protein
MARVELDEIWKIYPDGTRAVSALSLDIDDGEFVVLVGPSGCGKTTALRMLAGLEDVTGGEVRIDGRVVNRVPPRDRDIAMVFQNYALYPHLTVAENMGFGLKLRRVKKDEIRQRVEQAAGILGLEDLLDRKPRNLSGGQRQRVAMGRAIVREPQAFLMDEPLSNLDAKLRVQMRSEIARIQRDLGVTTVYVTHDQVEAMTMGDRVAVMRRGILQQVDAPQILYDRPCNVFVGGFIGSPAMNLVEATIEADDDGSLAARFGSARVALPAELVSERPALQEYRGGKVVLGVRPEEMEDADVVGLAPDDATIDMDVGLVEQMGSEAYVHFTLDAPIVLTEDTRDLVEHAGGSAAIEDIERKPEASPFVARVSPRTRLRKGDGGRLVVDARRLHFFDLETGAAIWDRQHRTVVGGDDTSEQREKAHAIQQEGIT